MEQYQIFVQRLNGGKITVDVYETDTIGAVKTKVCAQTGDSAQKITLLNGRTPLKDDKTLASYSIQKGCTILCAQSLQGG